jgi:hypothetical protein
MRPILLLALFSMGVHAAECTVEPRLCDIKGFVDSSKEYKQNNPLKLTVQDYLDFKPMVLKKIKDNYTINESGLEQRPFSDKGFKFAIPVTLDFEQLLVNGQRAYLAGKEDLAYRLLRYTQPRSISLISAIDKLSKLSPYNDAFNCFLVKKFSVRNLNTDKQSEKCKVSLLDVFVTLGGKTNKLKHDNGVLKIGQENNNTCIYYNKQKRCFNAKDFLPYKEALLLLNEVDVYSKKDKAHLLLVPSSN